MRDIAEGFEVEITEFNGESDHIHLLINSLKGVSSRKVAKNSLTLDTIGLTRNQGLYGVHLISLVQLVALP